MNYLAHGFRYAGDPWFVAGTALPDWLRVLDRRARVRPDALLPHRDHADPRVASLVRGALRHHEDDRRFHGSPAFDRARHAIAEILRGALSEADGHRPSFVAHVLLEMQLDASLVAEEPSRLETYYTGLASLDPEQVERALRSILPCPAGLARLVRGFVRERFIGDYADAAGLVSRLDLAVRGARQPALPSRLRSVLPATAACVAAERAGLLAGSS